MTGLLTALVVLALIVSWITYGNTWGTKKRG